MRRFSSMAYADKHNATSASVVTNIVKITSTSIYLRNHTPPRRSDVLLRRGFITKSSQELGIQREDTGIQIFPR